MESLWRLCSMFVSWLEHAGKHSRIDFCYTIIKSEIMVSAQATAAIDRFCPAFIGHDRL